MTTKITLSVNSYFVAVWNLDGPEKEVERIVPWKEWITTPVEGRPLHVTIVSAKDELDAFRCAQRGDDIFRDNKGAN